MQHQHQAECGRKTTWEREQTKEGEGCRKLHILLYIILYDYDIYVALSGSSVSVVY